MKLQKLDPELAYIGTSLLLPKKYVKEGPLISALSFPGKGDEVRVLVRQHPHHVEVPREFLSKEKLEKMGVSCIDLRPMSYPPIDLQPKSTFVLRPRQEDAWAATKGKGGGIICMSCGTGKSVQGLWVASQLKVPTLIVSAQKAHLDNWQKELTDWFDYNGEIGWIRGKKFEYDKGIVLSTVQTLAKRAEGGDLPPDFFRRFGLVIYDEVHHISAEHFCKASDISMGMRLGLTATPTRVDFNEGIFLAHIGKILHTDLEQEMTPNVEALETGVYMTAADDKSVIDTSGERNFSMLRSWLANNQGRNDFVEKQIRRYAGSRKLYILTHIKNQAEYLATKFSGSGCITGDTPANKRLEILNGHDLVFATIGVGAEAYNRKDLDMLFLLTPFAARKHCAATYIQCVGRILRELPGKPVPEVRIILDSSIPECDALVRSLLHESFRQGHNVKWNNNKPPRRKSKGW